MKTKFALLIVLSLFFFSCKKDKKKQDGKKAYAANFFPLGPNNFWKAYYHAPFGGPGSYEKGIDSFFVSLDTIGLNTISNINNIPDTNWQVYNIIKVKRTRKNFLDLTEYSEPIKNYGIVRIDTSLLKVYTAIPACTCWRTPTPPLPNYDYFNEIDLFDYNMQTNDTAFIHAVYNYNTTLFVDSFWHNGNIIKRQVFYDILNPGDTVAVRMQFGSIFNTNTFISEILPNITLTPNAYMDSLFFFYNLNDSLLIRKDTYNIP
jgi:hypothetical protein